MSVTKLHRYSHLFYSLKLFLTFGLIDVNFFIGLPSSDQIRLLLINIKMYLFTFNIFPSVPPSTDAYELRTQRISTRLFLLLFTFSLIILISYTSLVRITKTFTVQSPTFEQYSQLYSQYSQTLTCPCTQISINYENFIHIQYTLHQVCTSFFVTDQWLQYFEASQPTHYFFDDFLSTGPYVFQALRMFCELTNTTTINSLDGFYSNQYVTTSATPEQVFQAQSQQFIDQFKSSTINSFLLSLSLVRNTTQGNALFSGTQSNYQLHKNDNDTFTYTAVNVYSNCNCRYSSKCAEQSFIARYPDNETLFSIPEFYVGCYVIEALLQSSLRCFHNQSCINGLEVYLYPPAGTTLRALNSSMQSRYSVSSTIESMINNLMIEEWNATIRYTKYYDACRPDKCGYSVEGRNDLIYIITTVVGIVGGLTTVLKFTMPRLVKFIMYCRKKWERRQRVTPHMPLIQN